MIERPSEGEYNPYYSKYIQLVTETDVLGVLASQPGELRAAAASTGAEAETYRYAADKWSIRQVFGHMVDVERVFGYRALRIGRGDATPLPGFDENLFVARSPYERVPVAELVEEFAMVRRGNELMLRRLDAAHAAQKGTANGDVISVRALAYIMAGHVRHHLSVLQQRYGL